MTGGASGRGGQIAQRTLVQARQSAPGDDPVDIHKLRQLDGQAAGGVALLECGVYEGSQGARCLLSQAAGERCGELQSRS